MRARSEAFIAAVRAGAEYAIRFYPHLSTRFESRAQRLLLVWYAQHAVVNSK
jgi:hypothetical protein